MQGERKGSARGCGECERGGFVIYFAVVCRTAPGSDRRRPDAAATGLPHGWMSDDSRRRIHRLGDRAGGLSRMSLVEHWDDVGNGGCVWTP
jgi:hypothetical protein